jgi:hypothetical protein
MLKLPDHAESPARRLRGARRHAALFVAYGMELWLRLSAGAIARREGERG